MLTEIDTERSALTLLTHVDMTEPRALTVRGGEVVVYSSKCPDKETPNEDSAAVVDCGEHGLVMLVADGVGGHADGQLASRLALESVKSALADSTHEDAGLRPALLNGIESANRAVAELGTGAATTLAAATIEDQIVRTYHVGDSAVLLAGQRGKIKVLTISHSPVGYAVESGLLDADDALHHEDRHLVSNVIGSSEMRIEIGPRRKMSQFDTLLLASDGVFDNMHLDEIVEVIRKGPLLKAAKRLSNDVRARMDATTSEFPSKPDDATFVVFRQRRGQR